MEYQSKLSALKSASIQHRPQLGALRAHHSSDMRDTHESPSRAHGRLHVQATHAHERQSAQERQ